MYISTAVILVQEKELKEMLIQYRRNNQRDNITGVLLYGGEHYVQLIEGDEEDLRRLFAKIEKDCHHTNITKLADGKISERIFGNWSMGFKAISEELLSNFQGYVNPHDPKFLTVFPQPNEESAIDVLRKFAEYNIVNNSY